MRSSTTFQKNAYNPSTDPISKEKKRITCIKKYKKESTNQVPSIKLKKINTVHQNFGELGFKHESIREKRKRTCLMKYGVDNVMKLKINQQKRKETMNQVFDSGITFI